MSKKILIVVTSAARMTNGEATGLWLEEFAVPFLVFQQAGYEMVIASIQGGETPIDPRSGQELLTHPAWAEAAERLKQTQRLDGSTQAQDFDAIFLPGGHGTVFDLPGNGLLGQLLVDFDARGKIVSAVCHGPSGFVGPLRADGKPLVAGRTLAAFTDQEERAVGLDKAVPFLLESRLKELGATVITAADFSVHALRDGNFITGQNPPSSARTAELVVEALRG
jgi:putative intracellular protease/amidase